MLSSILSHRANKEPRSLTLRAALTESADSCSNCASQAVIHRLAPRAVNSAVECHLHTVEATGSIPVPPTKR